VGEDKDSVELRNHTWSGGVCREVLHCITLVLCVVQSSDFLLAFLLYLVYHVSQLVSGKFLRTSDEFCTIWTCDTGYNRSMATIGIFIHA